MAALVTAEVVVAVVLVGLLLTEVLAGLLTWAAAVVEVDQVGDQQEVQPGIQWPALVVLLVPSGHPVGAVVVVVVLAAKDVVADRAASA